MKTTVLPSKSGYSESASPPPKQFKNWTKSFQPTLGQGQGRLVPARTEQPNRMLWGRAVPTAIQPFPWSQCPGVRFSAILIALTTWFAPTQASAFDIDPQQVGSWPGYRRGPAQAVAVSGRYAYVAAEVLQIIDISNPARPQRVGSYGHSEYLLDVALSGNYACIANGHLGIEVVDVSNPAHPKQVSRYDYDQSPGAWANQVIMSGNLVYVSDQAAGLHILDLSDPANPKRAGGYKTTNGDPFPVAVSGRYAYVVERWGDGQRDRGRLHVLDVSDPANPRRVGGNDTSQGVESIAVSGHYLFMAQGGAGLQILDISDPANPRQAGGLKTGEYASRVAVSEDYAYVTYGFDLHRIDVRDPAAPLLAGTYHTGGYANDTVGMGDYVYIADDRTGLQIFDVSSESAPRRVGGLITNGDTRDVAVSGHYACLADSWAGLQVIDMASPANPRRVGGLETSGQASHVAVSGQFTYLAESWWDGKLLQERCKLNAIDLSDPANPRPVGGYEDTGRATDLAVSGRYAYLIISWYDNQLVRERGRLVVIDLGDPTHLRPVGGYEAKGRISRMAMSDHYVYWSESWWDEPLSRQRGKLNIIDVSNPARPRPTGSYGYESNIPFINDGQTGLAVSDNLVYIGGSYWDDTAQIWQGSIDVFDVSDATQPKIVSTLITDGAIRNVVVSDHLVHVVKQWGGLRVIDMSNPAAPRIVARYAIKGMANNMVLSGGYAWIASGDHSGPWFNISGEGLLAINLANPANPRRLGQLATIGSARKVGLTGNHACLVDENGALHVVDVANFATPKRVGGYTADQPILDMVASGDSVYVVEAWTEGSQGRGRLEVIDISQPPSPQRKGVVEIQREPTGVAVSGRFVCVTEGWPAGDQSRGRMSVIDLANPATPQHVGEYLTMGWAWGVTVSGNYAYLAISGMGLEVIDFSDPANPQRVGRYPTNGGYARVAMSGDKVYLAESWWDGQGGLIRFEVVDISNPPNPRRVGRVETSGDLAGVALSGNYAYLADRLTGLQVIDISDPAHPRRVGGNSAFQALAVAVKDNTVFVAGDPGLTILNTFSWLRLGPASLQDGRQIHLPLSGAKEQRVRVQRSRNLVDWENWQTVTVGENPVLLFDNITSGQGFFYRALEQ